MGSSHFLIFIVANIVNIVFFWHIYGIFLAIIHEIKIILIIDDISHGAPGPIISFIVASEASKLVEDCRWHVSETVLHCSVLEFASAINVSVPLACFEQVC